MTRRYIVGLALFLALWALTGCRKTDPEADRAAIERLVEQDSVWFDANTEVDSVGSGGRLDADTVVIWWRGKQMHEPAVIEINVVGDSAWVDWSRHNFGEFYSLVKPPDTTWLLWTKSVFETVRLRGIFMREGNDTEDDRGWKLTKVSLAFGRSDSAQTTFIDSLRIESASSGNVLIVDPLDTYYGLEDLIWFTPGEAVTVTLYTSDVAAEAFLHTWAFFYRRLHFDNVAAGVFRGTWNAQLLPFPRFAVFDLVTHGTIYGQEAPYDFCGWLLPYTIKTLD